MLLFLGEFAGRAEQVCPRATLRRVLKRAADLGYAVTAAAEFEFFIFSETPDSVREKGYRGLQNLTPGYFGYSLLRSSVHSELYQALLLQSAQMRTPIEGLHTETGPGVIEAALHYCEALEAADRAAIFKTFTKVLAQRRGLMATFMAKWSQQMPGQSGHLHMSMTRKDGAPAFYDEQKPHTMSDELRWFVGGQQALMPELLAMVASTVNSYSRLVPGFWAPTSATWGVENRTCALRVIQGGPHSQRVEYRIAAADLNPYLAIAAAVGSGLWGIEHRIEPDEPITGNAYERKLPAKRQLPRTLGDAAAQFARSKAAQELFGAPFVEHFAASREWEEREFRRAVTDWELARYFEII
jgi:glutamine synthetase